MQHNLCVNCKNLWPSGLRRWLQAPVRKGARSNPTAVTAFALNWEPANVQQQHCNHKFQPCQGNLAERSELHSCHAPSRRHISARGAVHRRAAISCRRPAAPTPTACEGGREGSTQRTGQIRGSMVFGISARHAGDPSPIPGRGPPLRLCKAAARKSPH